MPNGLEARLPLPIHTDALMIEYTGFNIINEFGLITHLAEYIIDETGDYINYA